MRAIHVVFLDKPRPALILTRSALVGRMSRVTIAPITSRIRGLSTELAVGARNGLPAESVVSLDNVETVPLDRLGERIGFLLPDQEDQLAQAISVAFDLEPTV
ncbi:MAG: type II toxin-antitoxin system PemK/MazF family toxin [Actinobacteria bacterium]|nr:type II toxin-antitoxin system PemK/MazF family toxin [Actinomycetota bacterium]